MRALLLAATAGLFFAEPAGAQSLFEAYQQPPPGFCAKNPDDRRCRKTTGSELMFKCDSSYSTDRAYCYGVLEAQASFGAELPEWACVPKNIPNQIEQLRLLFVREGQRMPEILHQPAERLLYYAVAKAFPCPSLRGR